MVGPLYAIIQYVSDDAWHPALFACLYPQRLRTGWQEHLSEGTCGRRGLRATVDARKSICRSEMAIGGAANVRRGFARARATAHFAGRFVTLVSRPPVFGLRLSLREHRITFDLDLAF